MLYIETDYWRGGQAPLLYYLGGEGGTTPVPVSSYSTRSGCVTCGFQPALYLVQNDNQRLEVTPDLRDT